MAMDKNWYKAWFLTHFWSQKIDVFWVISLPSTLCISTLNLLTIFIALRKNFRLFFSLTNSIYQKQVLMTKSVRINSKLRWIPVMTFLKSERNWVNGILFRLKFILIFIWKFCYLHIIIKIGIRVTKAHASSILI